MELVLSRCMNEPLQLLVNRKTFVSVSVKNAYNVTSEQLLDLMYKENLG